MADLGSRGIFIDDHRNNNFKLPPPLVAPPLCAFIFHLNMYISHQPKLVRLEKILLRFLFGQCTPKKMQNNKKFSFLPPFFWCVIICNSCLKCRFQHLENYNTLFELIENSSSCFPFCRTRWIEHILFGKNCGRKSNVIRIENSIVEGT